MPALSAWCLWASLFKITSMDLHSEIEVLNQWKSIRFETSLEKNVLNSFSITSIDDFFRLQYLPFVFVSSKTKKRQKINIFKPILHMQVNKTSQPTLRYAKTGLYLIRLPLTVLLGIRKLSEFDCIYLTLLLPVKGPGGARGLLAGRTLSAVRAPA